VTDDDSGSAGHFLNRRRILSGEMEAIVREAGHGHRIRPAEQRLAIKRAMISALPAHEDVWLFGYGSLIWNPAFEYDERVVGTVHGYHRYFCFWTTMGRGSPEHPGMMLALEPGGSCKGVAFRIRRERAYEELRSVFLREMMTGSYHCRWANVQNGDRRIRAITFVANHESHNYAGKLPMEKVAYYVAHAEGRIGRSRDYLRYTVRHMRALGIEDSGLNRLLALVEEERRKEE